MRSRKTSCRYAESLVSLGCSFKKKKTRLKKYIFFYLFIFGCTGSSLLHTGFLYCGVRASHCGGCSCFRARVLWCTGFCSSSVIVENTGLVALPHVESSQIRVRTRVPCFGKRTLNLWTTKKVLLD